MFKEKNNCFKYREAKRMLDMRQRQAITKELKARYNKATKKEKAKILDEFAALTGYNRCYASWVDGPCFPHQNYISPDLD